MVHQSDKSMPPGITAQESPARKTPPGWDGMTLLMQEGHPSKQAARGTELGENLGQ